MAIGRGRRIYGGSPMPPVPYGRVGRFGEDPWERGERRPLPPERRYPAPPIEGWNGRPNPPTGFQGRPAWGIGNSWNMGIGQQGRPGAPTSARGLNTWARWQQVHPGTPYSDYQNWYQQYGSSGAQINGEFGIAPPPPPPPGGRPAPPTGGGYRPAPPTGVGYRPAPPTGYRPAPPTGYSAHPYFHPWRRHPQTPPNFAQYASPQYQQATSQGYQAPTPYVNAAPSAPTPPSAPAPDDGVLTQILSGLQDLEAAVTGGSTATPSVSGEFGAALMTSAIPSPGQNAAAAHYAVAHPYYGGHYGAREGWNRRWDGRRWIEGYGGYGRSYTVRHADNGKYLGKVLAGNIREAGVKAQRYWPGRRLDVKGPYAGGEDLRTAQSPGILSSIYHGARAVVGIQEDTSSDDTSSDDSTVEAQDDGTDGETPDVSGEFGRAGNAISASHMPMGNPGLVRAELRAERGGFGRRWGRGWGLYDEPLDLDDPLNSSAYDVNVSAPNSFNGELQELASWSRGRPGPTSREDALDQDFGRAGGRAFGEEGFCGEFGVLTGAMAQRGEVRPVGWSHRRKGWQFGGDLTHHPIYGGMKL